MRFRTPQALAATLLAQFAALGTAHAQTVWDGSGSDTNINTAANWNNDSVFTGSGSGTFGTAGSTATMNVAGSFTTLTFNRNDSGGFTINGASNLTVTASGSGATANLSVSDTAGNGVTTISAPLRVNTDAGGTRLLVIDNRENGTAGESLVIAGGISASNANAYGLRFAGAGSTRISGPITGTLTTNIQQASVAGQNFSGTFTIAGNQTLGTSTQVSIAGNGGSVNGNVGSSAKIVMGDSDADVQSWGSTTVNQASTIEIRSTATLTSGVSLSNAASNGSSGGTLDVSGSLSATTLAIGGAAYSGVLKVSGSATFSGAITSGATAGSKIVGGGATTGTLTLASGTVGSAVALGGAGTNENNLALVKTSTGTLTVSSANNTFTGGTTLVDGGSGTFGIALGANNALGTGPLVIGTAATGGNGARLRMAGFNQAVSALSSGATSNARVIENFGAAGSTLTVNGASSGTYAGFLRDRSTASATATGSLGLVKDGAGTLTLSNTSNQYTGATVINDGVLEVAQLTNGGIVKTVTSTAGSATVTMSDTTGVTNGMTFVAANLPTGFAVSTVDSGTNITINTTAGIVTGSSTAHFGVASSIGLATSAASNLVFGGGTLRYTGSASISTDRNFTVNSGQSAKWDVSNVAATLTLAGGAAASTGGFQKLGAGSLVLTGAQAYTGDTVVSAGVLALGAGDRISDGSKLVLAGGTFDLNGFSETLGALVLNADAILDLDNIANASGTISFAASNLESWSTFGLSIAGTAFAANSVRFGVDANGLTAGQLANITVNGVGGWGLDGGGYLVSTIPEPSSFAVIAGLVALAGTGLRRRRRA